MWRSARDSHTNITLQVKKIASKEEETTVGDFQPMEQIQIAKGRRNWFLDMQIKSNIRII